MYYFFYNYLSILYAVSLNTPPGTKILIKSGILPVSHGILLLNPHIVHTLGGRVINLVEKWELNKVNYTLFNDNINMQKYRCRKLEFIVVFISINLIIIYLLIYLFI